MFFAPIACATSVSKPLFMPSIGAIAKIFISMLPIPTAARMIGSFKDPMNAKFIVYCIIFSTEPIDDGIANCTTRFIIVPKFLLIFSKNFIFNEIN